MGEGARRSVMGGVGVRAEGIADAGSDRCLMFDVKERQFGVNVRVV